MSRLTRAKYHHSQRKIVCYIKRGGGEEEGEERRQENPTAQSYRGFRAPLGDRVGRFS